MYFDSRQQAGEMLAQQIAPTYRYENCAVVALNDGGVLVGERIASALHCVLTLIISEEIPIPGEAPYLKMAIFHIRAPSLRAKYSNTQASFMVTLKIRSAKRISGSIDCLLMGDD
jgi:predicted phosphoribosyltransferase